MMKNLSREEREELHRRFDAAQRQRIVEIVPNRKYKHHPSELKKQQLRRDRNIANGLRYTDDIHIVCDTCGWTGTKYGSKRLQHNDDCKYKQKVEDGN